MKLQPLDTLRAIRKQKGWTQAQLGERVGRSGAFIAELELGRKRASIETLQRLASILEISIDAIVNADKKERV